MTSIDPRVKAAFDRKAGPGVSLDAVVVEHNETVFRVRVHRLRRTISIGCGKVARGEDAIRSAERAAAYATTMWSPKEVAGGHR